MKRPSFGMLLVALALTSCETMHNAAVSTFRVVDAPHAYVRRQLGLDENGQPVETTTTTTAQTTYSDTADIPPQQPYAVQAQPYQTNPNQPPARPPQSAPVQTQQRMVEQRATPPPERPRPSATPRVAQNESRSTAPKPTATPRIASTDKTASDIPYAKPVPGKPGYVYSPFDPNGGYVDVKGYAPGQKVKDPYSGKIFLVP